MSSSNSKLDRPRIPGRCDICERKDGSFDMTLLQCSKCKVCVHKECYMVYPEDDDDFVCYACAAVARTYQAVDTHMSNRFYEIEQKERPAECALCSVKDSLHVMNPLFDYHGTGGRQICCKPKNGERKLIWAHSLCALYLAAKGFLYACHKDGDYQGMEDDDESDADPRSPNPECNPTKKFVRMYGTDAIHHFRYYMTPPNVELNEMDDITRAVHLQRTGLKCIECGLDDSSKKSMRIALQCVTNDEDEFEVHKERRMARSKKVDREPCCQALHVGCARWGHPSSELRQCFYIGGDNDRRQNVQSIYCKKHAENLDEKFATPKPTHTTLSKRKRAGEKDRRGEMQQHNIRPKKTTKQDSKRISSYISGKPSLDAAPKARRIQSKNRDKESKRGKAPDGTGAVVANAGEQPTLAKRRRQIANEKSSNTESKDATPSDNGSRNDDNDGDLNMNALDSDEAVRSDDSASDRDLKKKQKRKQNRQLHTDRWSNLFIGLHFEMGNVFTIEKLSDKT